MSYRTTVRRFVRPLLLSPTTSFSTSASTKKVTAPPKNQGRNYVTALALIGFVGGIYYTAISKMRGSDELGKVMDREELKAKQKK